VIPLEFIQSKENLLIKKTKKLRERKYRVLENKFLVEGFRFVGEALDSSYEVPNVFISDSQMKRWESFGMESKLQNISKVYCVSDEVLKELCSTDTPQGVVCIANIKKSPIKYGKGFYVLADQIQDPGNMGTIIRTAHAANALGVITTKGTVDIYNEKTLRATMGSIFYIPVIEDFDSSILNSLKENGFKIIVSSLEASKNIYDENLTGRVILCIGNEGNGISSEIFEMADIKIKIPMPGGAESLNAGIAASIIIYETLRQNLIS
jgi:RNA methyltransferase, TrmH family